MPITLDGSLGITTPMYNGSITANAVTPSVNMKSRIINGAMVIDQRNAGASVALTGASKYTVDRFTVRTATGTGNTAIQSTTATTGFINSLLITIGTGASPAASENNYILQSIEGLNISDLAWGTANAKTVTLSFQVRSSLTGTFGGALRNADGSRSYPYTYTISTANTWTPISVTIAGDTTGTWLTNNSDGILVFFDLGSGSTLQGTAGAWAAADYRAATGCVKLVGTSSATFYITGVQLEVGSTATSFDYRPYGTELALCQRYFALNTPGCGKTTSTTNMTGTIGCPVTMRVAPTVTIFSGTNKVTDLGIAFRNITAITAWEGATVSGGNLTTTVSTTTSGAVSTYLGDAIAMSSEL
jgi:hypothetical protein